MSAPILGVKSYGWEWFTEFGLSMDQAADRLVQQGFDWVLTQNLIDPLPGSAVAQVPPQDGYDDVSWIRALRDKGLSTYQTTAFFNEPAELTREGAILPIDQHGKPFEQFGWYAGVNPCDEGYVQRKIELVAEAVDATKPDGLFVSFFRFPGFWELWLPDAPGFTGTRRADIREYSFDQGSLERFQAETGISLSGSLQQQRDQIVHELRREWTAWKSTVLQDIAHRLRTAVQDVHPGTELMLNAFGLRDGDFGGALPEVLSQRIADLDPYFETVELMFYFQIQKRLPSPWIQERVAEVRTQTDRRVLADLQAGPEYLEPMYADGQRKRSIDPEEWTDAVRAVSESGADGVLIYSWRDLLRDEAAGGSRVSTLQAYKEGVL